MTTKLAIPTYPTLQSNFPAVDVDLLGILDLPRLSTSCEEIPSPAFVLAFEADPTDVAATAVAAAAAYNLC